MLPIEPKHCRFWWKNIENPFLFPPASRVFQITVLCQVSAFPLFEAVLGEMAPRIISKVFGKYLHLMGPQTKKLISMMDNWF